MGGGLQPSDQDLEKQIGTVPGAKLNVLDAERERSWSGSEGRVLQGLRTLLQSPDLILAEAPSSSALSLTMTSGS